MLYRITADGVGLCGDAYRHEEEAIAVMKEHLQASAFCETKVLAGAVRSNGLLDITQ